MQMESQVKFCSPRNNSGATQQISNSRFWTATTEVTGDLFQNCSDSLKCVSTSFKAKIFTVAAQLKVLARIPSDLGEGAQPRVKDVNSIFQINLGSWHLDYTEWAR